MKTKEQIVIDATNAILGRLSSYVAKQALYGKNIVIINSEKAIIIGDKYRIIETYIQKRGRRGISQRGPAYPSTPERILRRTIRGMLAKEGRGREAFKRIKCYAGLPKEYENTKKIVAGKKKDKYYISLEELAKQLKN